MKKKTLALLLALVMALSLLAGCGGDNNTPSNPDTPPAGTQTPDTPDTPPAEPEAPAEPTTPGGDLPRNETLYFGGQQWGEVNSWNPVGANQNNAMAIASNAAGSRTVKIGRAHV